MSFPAWSKCFLSCGFLIWKSRLASPERQFQERRQLDAHGRRAGGRDDANAHGTADHGTLEHEPTGFVQHRRTNSALERWQIEPTGRPRGERDPDIRLKWRDAGT